METHDICILPSQDWNASIEFQTHVQAHFVEELQEIGQEHDREDAPVNATQKRLHRLLMPFQCIAEDWDIVREAGGFSFDVHRAGLRCDEVGWEIVTQTGQTSP